VQKTKAWWQSIHPEKEQSNGSKAAAYKPSDHGGKASAKKRANTLLGTKASTREGGREPKAAKHPPGIHRPSAKKTTPTAKPPQHEVAKTLSAAKYLLRRRLATTTAKHPSRKSNSGKASASNDVGKVKCSRTGHSSVTHRHKQAQLGASATTNDTKSSSEGSGRWAAAVLQQNLHEGK